ncbi:peptidyl-prolyl cis-trans isomerase [Sulfurospirillum sp. T05]|uniref:Peptidyl-prolyl cis-trans isomerase n=1 Tax=Sulfurospirillum tamanense TaxID=2813362 RepID=A0ABS2WS39_9BACT|nr:peptidylprolyl isomerase [Sulfurospirillum tamanensis]MBN2964488.1 peptidyl-prolyl cis-trans isomerase [Sulfurospirillum tamanensis]
MTLKPLKLSLLAVVATCSLSYAGLVNAISVTVNSEPITLYEIHKAAGAKNISLREALDMLVQERLEDSQIKRLGISANAFEVQSRMEGIAAQNGISVTELTAFIASRNMGLEAYKKELERAIKQEKLYQRIFANAIAPIDGAEVRRYYEANPEEFLQANTFQVIRYEAPNAEALERVIASPMSVVSGVTIKEETLQAGSLDGRTHYYLNQTNEGEFTPIATGNQGVAMYLVSKKSGFESVPFERARGAIENHLEEKRRQEAINNYFEKLKASADIVVLRRP